MPDRSDREGYCVQPIAEAAPDGRWAAGVVLSVDSARGIRAAKSLSVRRFDSRDAAIAFAVSEYGQIGATGSASPSSVANVDGKG